LPGTVKKLRPTSIGDAVSSTAPPLLMVMNRVSPQSLQSASSLANLLSDAGACRLVCEFVDVCRRARVGREAARRRVPSGWVQMRRKQLGVIYTGVYLPYTQEFIYHTHGSLLEIKIYV